MIEDELGLIVNNFETHVSHFDKRFPLQQFPKNDMMNKLKRR
jgi:hypothetical protein